MLGVNVEVSQTPDGGLVEVRIQVEAAHANGLISRHGQEEALPCPIEPVDSGRPLGASSLDEAETFGGRQIRQITKIRALGSTAAMKFVAHPVRVNRDQRWPALRQPSTAGTGSIARWPPISFAM